MVSFELGIIIEDQLLIPSFQKKINETLESPLLKIKIYKHIPLSQR
jgi:hypothetical protein